MSTVSVATAQAVRIPVIDSVRPAAQGKFLFVGSEKFFVKGVTYGAFRPNAAGVEFHDIGKIRQDFAMMARNAVNTVRIQHTVPPTYLLDIAAEHDLRVMVGLSAEQYVGYLLDGGKARNAFEDTRRRVRSVNKHPALLCYCLGNEIPASMARVLGRQRIERYLRDLHDLVKDEDPESLVTYVNYPSTEYLQLPFLDICSFNVYLEKQPEFAAYLARLQNIAMDRPLLITELGLDSRRAGCDTQARVLDWQVRTTFDAGCAGAVVFSWTDEWFRGGDVEDWEFGLTDRQRRPRQSLGTVRRAFEDCPFRPDEDEPFMSVVVCTYNGSRTIDECLSRLTQINYRNYEVIVVDDGSTDNTFQIINNYDVRIIRTENRGLSAARNTGMEQARGEYVIYLDDDAYPDPDWLSYYAAAFRKGDHALIGGPNLVPPHDPAVAQCVARAPGGPTHVLLTDTLAEHVPGCNMAFRKSCLEEIGGFDATFRTAGDDVDICWRIQEKGWTIGFAPAAMVWHHRRGSVARFWKQQRGYGHAEALLQQKWPARFNASNHLPWHGRIYLAGVANGTGSRSVIYHGVWGEAPFQGLHHGTAFWEHLLELPELYLMNAALLVLSVLGFFWPPMFLFLPLLLAGAGYPLVQAARKARRTRFPATAAQSLWHLRSLTAVLHVIQPLARLYGRLQHGLTPWKRRGNTGAAFPLMRRWASWTENWIDPTERLRQAEQAIAETGVTVHRGNAYEPWDLDVIGGLLGSARLLMAVEDHGGGRQYVRFVAWPRYSRAGVLTSLAAAFTAFFAAWSGEFVVAGVLALGAAILLFRLLLEAGRSLASIFRACRTAAVTEVREPVRDRVPMHSGVAQLQAAVRRSGPDG